jgi:acetyl esterase/lipase/lysophospholipase L1-like esterase
MRLAALALAAVVGAVAEPTVDVYLVGDSTMADKPTPETNPERGWGQLLPHFFDEHVAIHNHAVNGRSTKSFIDEGKWRAVERALKPGDYVFIQFGHNDEKAEDSARYAAPYTAYRKNLERFVAETRDKRAIPVLFTPIVRRKFNARGTLEDTHGAYPLVVREVARDLNVALVDLETSTEELVRGAGPEESKTLYVWVAPGESKMYPEGRQDDTHLSVLGATRIAGFAAAAIARSTLPLRQFVRNVDGASREDEILLWPRGAPGALGSSPDDQPTITPFLAPMSGATGAGMLVFPGGGYEHLAWDKEGTNVAVWLNSLGVSAFVVRYRLGPRYRHPTMLIDARRAVRVVRSRARDWGIDPLRIGVIGFSAGGHMASSAATQWTLGDSTNADPVERVSSRPDLAILAYPVITMNVQYAHPGSRHNLIGDHPDDRLVRATSNELHVTRETPPTFIVATSDDATVPSRNSLMFYDALRAAGVPAELHLLETGRHGFGLAPGEPSLAVWVTACESWLRWKSWAR